MRDLLIPMQRFLSGRKTQRPMFGSMTEWEWARWAYLHMDRHLRQLGV